MKRLRTIRKSKGLTMKELGEKIGVSESAISQYETGKREADYETMLKIGKILDCSIDYLLGNEHALPQDKYSALFRHNISLALELVNSEDSSDIPDAKADYYNLYALSEGGYPLSLREAVNAADALGESLDNLLREDYEEYTQQEEPTPVSEDGLSDAEKLLMRYVRELNPSQQQMLLAQMQVMKESQRESSLSSVQK